MIITKSLATPLLVPMIEEGFYKNKISNTILSNYLEREELKGIDHLILGCTHYPLIEDEIKHYYDGQVKIINSAKIVAKYIRKKLAEANLLNDQIVQVKNKNFMYQIIQNPLNKVPNIFLESVLI